jgi:LuxR family maltose regulon positive regulatory protein
MSGELLQTKLYVPPLRPFLVPRPRLVEKLTERLDNKLTLISAPAGFGKTSLISEWVQQCERAVSWASLDEGDNDPARFLAYLVAALQKIASAIGESALAQRPSPEMPVTEMALTAVINDIAANQENFILVLDDYHLITAQPIHDALTFLLDHQPPQMHLVIATRADPPLPLALLRGRGQLTELRQADLRFTPDEAAAFLNQVMGLGLSADDVSALSARTEGWITGLQMAAVSMAGREDTTAFIRAFAGSDRYIADYLVEEVLNRQPAHLQDFLLKTAVLDRLTAPLCDFLIADFGMRNAESTIPQSEIRIPNSQVVLEQLERANLFIVPLDEQREWYRYHRLFTDLLRRRLHQSQPAQVPELHRRASEWYEQNGLIAIAIDHALSAADFERASRLIEQTAETTFRRSELVTFRGWIKALPDELLHAKPVLCLYHAFSLLQSGRSLDVVESHLQRLVESGLMSGQVKVLQALLAVYHDQIPQAIELSRQALTQLPPDDTFLRHAAIWNLGFSHLADGDTEASIQALAEAARTSQAAGNTTVAVSALCQMARLSLRQGELQKVQALYHEALALAVDEAKRPLPIAGLALIGLGELAREWNELEAATDYLNDGIQLARQWRGIAAQTGYIYLARLKQAQGDEDGANASLTQARQLALKSDATDMDDLVAAFFQARIWVAQGNIAAAMRWAGERGVNQLDPVQLEANDTSLVSHLHKYEVLVMARILLAQNRSDEALSLLRPLLSWMERQERKDLQIEIQILIALAYQAQDDVTQALAALERALSLAEPGGYVRIFVDEGQPMIRLLQQAFQQGIMPAYTGRLLSECGPVLSEAEGMQNADFGATQSEVRSPKSEMVEPLSQREIEILQLIADGLSNQEIGQRLVLALPTVKWHASNIYGKLGVNNRGTAVARARELHILP